MTHEHLPHTYALVRPAPAPDPDALARAVMHVGSDFPGVGSFLTAGWIAS
jgi:hypothetical protein